MDNSVGKETYTYEFHNVEKPKSMIDRYGWICPNCGRAVAPWVSYCECKDIQSNKIDVEG